MVFFSALVGVFTSVNVCTMQSHNVLGLFLPSFFFTTFTCYKDGHLRNVQYNTILPHPLPLYVSVEPGIKEDYIRKSQLFEKNPNVIFQICEGLLFRKDNNYFN